jgi:orotidine-5'-phosphate decarboxylase
VLLKLRQFDDVRRIIPNHFLLVPGVGAQGGSLAEVCKHGLIKNDIGLLINSSRAIIYASNGEDFAEAAAKEAKKVADEMKGVFLSAKYNMTLRAQKSSVLNEAYCSRLR